jgi:hypothetical protein
MGVIWASNPFIAKLGPGSNKRRHKELDENIDYLVLQAMMKLMVN